MSRTVEFVGGSLCGMRESVRLVVGKPLPSRLHDHYVSTFRVTKEAKRPIYEFQPPPGVRNPNPCKCGQRGCPNYGKAGA